MVKLNKEEIEVHKKYHIPNCSNYYKRQINAIFINSHNSLVHEAGKLLLAYDIKKKGGNFITEAMKNDNPTRIVDVVDLTSDQELEVESDFKKSFAKSLKKQQVEEVRLFEQRMKELDTEKNPRTLERLKKELTKAEDQALQMTFSEEKNRERRERLKELEGRLSDEEWERQHTQVMLLKQRLESERERVLTKVLPKRYQVATVNVQPVAVKILVREGS